jgi:hypothetical protein
MKWAAKEFASWPKGITHVSRPTRNGAPPDQKGLPATNRALNMEVEWTKEIQNDFHNLNCVRGDLDPADPIAKKFFAKFIGGHSWAFDFSYTQQDFINGTNPGQPGVTNKVMNTSGAIVQILDDMGDYWKVNAINVNKHRISDVPVEGNPDLYFEPANSARDGMIDKLHWVREDIVQSFGHYNDRVIMPLLSNLDYLLFPKNRVVELENGLVSALPIFVR